MDISCVNIKIIDTFNNTLPLVVEFAERGAPQFIYNGKNGRYVAIVSSELHFSMKVSDRADAKFLHLFTGTETRYRVEFEDFSDELNPVILWSGFLLPEQFGEPYTNQVFFVNFIATDGLGRIKQATLSSAFYGVKKGISVVFADCLKLTGLSFKLFIAPAIVNAVQDLKYSQIAVNTESYVGKKKNKDPYNIINDLLLSIGCKLFQWQEAWYIIGINRLADNEIEFEEYDSDGVYVQQTTLVRLQTSATFFETPTISVQPPFKRVTLNWDKDQDDEILPERITYQPFLEPQNWDDDVPIELWLQSNSNFKTSLKSYTQYVNFIYTPGGVLYQPTFEPLPTEDPFYISLEPATVGGDDEDVNYISLETSIYLEASSGDEKNLTLDIEFKFMSFTDISTAFNNGDYDSSFKYELLFDGNVLISNKTSFTNYEGFDFELSLGKNFEITGKLSIKKIPINTNGILDIRLSAPIAPSVAGDRLMFKTVKITYNTTDETLDKVRNIDFTTKQTLNVFHSDDAMDLTNRQFLFTNDVVVNINVTIPALTHQITILSKVENTTYGITSIKWYMSQEDYLLIQANPQYLYIQDENTGAYVNYFLSGAITGPPIFTEDGNFYLWDIIIPPASVATYLKGNNLVWVLAPTSTVTITDQRYLRERWKRYEHTEEIRYIDALARVHHDTVKDAAYKINGMASGFIGPLELVLFTFITGRKFVIANSKIPIQNSNPFTQIDLVEATKHDVNDYATE